jgi:hypothetical protein
MRRISISLIGNDAIQFRAKTQYDSGKKYYDYFKLSAPEQVVLSYVLHKTIHGDNVNEYYKEIAHRFIRAFSKKYAQELRKVAQTWLVKQELNEPDRFVVCNERERVRIKELLLGFLNGGKDVLLPEQTILEKLAETGNVDEPGDNDRIQLLKYDGYHGFRFVGRDSVGTDRYSGYPSTSDQDGILGVAERAMRMARTPPSSSLNYSGNYIWTFENGAVINLGGVQERVVSGRLSESWRPSDEEIRESIANDTELETELEEEE